MRAVAIGWFILCGCGLSGTASASPSSEATQALEMPLEQRLDWFREQAPDSYVQLTQLAFDHRQSMTSRWRAITTMGRIDAVHFRTDLEKALMSSEWFLRNAALIAEQTAPRDHAVRWSAKLLADPALVVRTQAVENLLRLNAREAEPLIWQEIFAARNFHGHEGLWVRVHMAEALARFAFGGGHTPDFLRLLNEPDPRLHRWAILGLENTTGFKLGNRDVPLEIRRQQWLDRLGSVEI